MNTREIAGSLFAIILAVLYFFDMEVNMWTFHFIHDNIFHLCGNLLALSFFDRRFDWKLFPAAYLTGSLVWVLTQIAVGASAIIFFMWGTTLFGDLRRLNNKNKTIYLISITATLSVSLFIPDVSFTLHFIPFVVGFIIGMAKYLITKFSNDLKGVTF